jgi:XTP/dITP diphosphohydrolase
MTKSEKRARQMEAFGRILDVMDELREKCPWDREQTIKSLRTMTIEETFELSDAILNDDLHNVSKELGDLLLHVIFYAKIGEEQGAFDIVDVIDRLCSKLIYRHPHVYSTVEVNNAGQVVQNWEQLKTKEKDGNKTILSGVPESMPSMIKASRMQEKASAVGFDWEKKEDVWEKVKEECSEIEKELNDMAALQNDANATEQQKAECFERAQDEVGDLFFALINAARLYKVNPDTALERTCAKFRRRFTYLEEHTIRQGRNLTDMTLAEMDAIWDEGKAKGL